MESALKETAATPITTHEGIPQPRSEPRMLYDGFVPGQSLGSATYAVDAEAVAQWCRLFPDDDLGGLMPHGMIAVVSMRAYGEVIPGAHQAISTRRSTSTCSDCHASGKNWSRR
ncbi:hypothetical protein ACFQU7_34330 [Pseudoroseomonas wenyumeiae]